MAGNVDGRGRGRGLLLVMLLAAAAWLLWSQRASARVALGNICVARTPPPSTAPARASAPARVSATAVAAPARPEPQPEPRPLPGSAAPLPDGSAPGPEYTIKGNAGSMLFHLPSSPYYQRTKAALWFRTPEDARAAGFTEWKPKRRTPR